MNEKEKDIRQLLDRFMAGETSLEEGANGVSVKNDVLTLIPYYAWNHRGANQMNVWFYQGLSFMDK